MKERMEGILRDKEGLVKRKDGKKKRGKRSAFSSV
jgi:hypothetical protein